MTKFEEVLETILEEYARRDIEGDFDTWEKTDSFVKEKAEVLLAYADLKKEPVSEEWCKEFEHVKKSQEILHDSETSKENGDSLTCSGSEELEKAAVEEYKKIVEKGGVSFFKIFKAGAQWKEEQIKEACKKSAYFIIEELEVMLKDLKEKNQTLWTRSALEDKLKELKGE